MPASEFPAQRHCRLSAPRLLYRSRVNPFRLADVAFQHSGRQLALRSNPALWGAHQHRLGFSAERAAESLRPRATAPGKRSFLGASSDGIRMFLLHPLQPGCLFELGAQEQPGLRSR
jgi:hypothetical protein